MGRGRFLIITEGHMALTAPQLATIKRRSGEAHKATPMVSDADIQLIADESGLIKDSDDLAPSAATYTQTYDLNAVVASVWEEKAGLTAEGFDFAAEGGSFTRSQHYRHCVEQAKRWHGRMSNLSV